MLAFGSGSMYEYYICFDRLTTMTAFPKTLVGFLCWILLCWVQSGSRVVTSFVFQPQKEARPSQQQEHMQSSSCWVGRRISTSRLNRRHFLASNDNDDDGESSIPQLPAFESHKTGPAASSVSGDAAQLHQKPFVASRKFQLQYTCNVCDTRNAHSVSRVAYLQGVVIARCKGCQSQHLIADNLGYTGGFPGANETTIEEYFAGRGEHGGRVNRVSKEVFDLEHILQGHNAESGAIMGENGELALE